MDGGAGVTVVHYVNQFFAGLGGEGAADQEPVRFDGGRGPGKALEAAGLHIDLTLACGDDRFALHEGDCLAMLLAWIEEADAGVVVCGPSFGSGRYGYACGVLARELGRRGTAVVAAMTTDSPGVLASEGAAYIVPTTANVAGMRDAVPVVASLATRLASGAPVGSPDEEGYLPRRLRVNVRSESLGAERAIDLVLAKLRGDIRTEIAPPTDRVAPPEPLADPAGALVALVTEAGCVPQGNPDRLPTRHANVWLRYPIGERAELAPEDYLSVHAGFDTTEANRDPDRLVPLDAARALVEAGRIGRIHDEFFTTTGVDTPVAVSTRMGQEIGVELRNAGVEAVILTGT